MRVRLALIPLIATVALLAGCATATPPPPPPTSTGPVDNGVSALPATDIVSKMQAALAAAKSYHILGSVTENGQKVNLDLRFSGKDFTGTVEISSFKLEVIGVGTDIYTKAPDDFWAAQIPAAQASTFLALVKGKYVKADAKYASIAALVDPLRPETLTKPGGTVTKGDTKAIDGNPAVGVVDSKDGTRFYVATTGQPVPLSIEPGSATGPNVQFKDYDVPVSITAPAASDVFDLKALIGN
jgi:hypothetical protein